MATENERTDAAAPGSADASAPAPVAGVLDDLAAAAAAAGTLLGALGRLARAELRLAWRGVRLAAWALLATVLLLLFLLLTLVILLVWLLLHATGSLGAGLALTALVLLLALLGGFALPLAAVQILWINIVTESTLTVNLVMDPPDGDEMRRAPIARDRPLLDRAMLGRIALLVPVAVALTFGWFAWRQSQALPYDVVRTETFTLLALCQWFNMLNCQSSTASALRLGVLRNPWLVAGFALSIALQAAVLYLPVLHRLFHTVPLSPGQLLGIAAAASCVLWVEEARKAFVRWRAQPGAAA